MFGMRSRRRIFRAACERWPGTPITLRQGAIYVVQDQSHAALLAQCYVTMDPIFWGTPARLKRKRLDGDVAIAVAQLYLIPML